MHDPDTQAVIDALDAAQGRSGLTQAEFARALGTSPSRYSTYRTGKVTPSATLLMRAERISRALAKARAERLPTSLDAARSIRAALEEKGALWAFTLTLEARDRLRSILNEKPEAAEAWEAQPSLGDDRWDILLAALLGHEFTEAGRPAPKWTMRALDEEWTPVESIRLDREQVRQQTPRWLAERNIFVAERDMANA